MAGEFPIIIRLAGVPEGKGRPRFVRATGRVYTPDKTVRFENSLRLAGQDAMGDRRPVEGPLSVLIIAAMPIPASKPKRWQQMAREGSVFPANNYAKSLDALNEVVFRDDAQIVDGRVIKEFSEKPELIVIISEAARFVRPAELTALAMDEAA